MSARFSVLKTQQAIELDRLCDEFEDAWRADQAPAVEDFLQSLDGLAYRSALAMLLELELDLRRERGEAVDRGSLFRRFPEHQDTVLEVLEADRDTHHEDDRGTLDLSSCRLGRYEFAADKPLGEGTFGKVYRAWDARLHRWVAIKVPRPDKLDKDLFLREARAVSQLKHRNICTVFDVEEDDGRPYMVMELIEGPKLSERLGRGRLPTEEAVRIVYEVALALEEAHRQGVIHRDLKPANIMLRDGHEPVVLDFGLAKVAAASETLMKADTALGTALYMPPEQASGDHRAVGPASDVYSLGMVLYEALTGELPFSGSARSVMEQVKTREVPSAADRCHGIPHALAAVCAKAASKKTKDRYAGMADFAAALAPFLPAGHPGRQPLRGSGQRAGWGTPVRAAAAVLACAAVVLLWGWGWGWFEQPAPSVATAQNNPAEDNPAQSDPAENDLRGNPASAPNAGEDSAASPNAQDVNQHSSDVSAARPDITNPAGQADSPTEGPLLVAPPRGEAESLPSAESPLEAPPLANMPVEETPPTPPAATDSQRAVPAPPSPLAPTAGTAAADQPADDSPEPRLLSEIGTLVERLSVPPGDPASASPADAIRDGLEIGFGIWRGTEKERREFWDTLRERLRKPGPAMPADRTAPAEDDPRSPRDNLNPGANPPRVGPIRGFFRPRER